jgi:hypothetical protein
MLAIVATAYSSGVPAKYRVTGLPPGEIADISLKGGGSVRTWKIRRNNKGRFTGTYASEEMALAALESEIYPITRRDFVGH